MTESGSNRNWDDAELLERARKLHHRFLNEAEGEYVALVIGRLIDHIEDQAGELSNLESTVDGLYHDMQYPRD